MELFVEPTLNKTLKKGVEAHRAGQIKKANTLYSAVLKVHPTHPDANHNMGILLVTTGKIKNALPFFKRALEANLNVGQFWASYIDVLIKLGQRADARKVFAQAKVKGANGQTFDQLENRLLEPSAEYPDPPSEYVQSTIDLYMKGQFQQALFETLQMLERFPSSVVLYNIAGACNAGLMKFDAAINSYKKALQTQPDCVEAFYNMGSALQAKGNLDLAIDSYKKALAIKPDYAEAYNNMGNALKAKGEFVAAIESFKQAVQVNPDYAESYSNMGIVLHDNGDLDSAIDNYKQALKLRPHYAEAYNNMGNALKAKGDFQLAIDSYNQAVKINPNYAEAYSNMGVSFQGKGDLDAAILSYSRALKIQPDYADAFNNLGNTFREKSNPDAAIRSYKKALKSNPLYAEACSNMGLAFKDKGDIPAAINSFKQALQIKPDYAYARAQKLFQQSHICDWVDIQEEQALIPELGVSTYPISPFTMLSFEDCPERHRVRSKNYIAQTYPLATVALAPILLKNARPIRIGYFSADFHNHATMYLMIKVFENHNKNEFEINAYSFGPHSDDDMRQRLASAVDVFHDVSHMSDQDIALAAQTHGIDIAVDLKGFTKGGRFGIFTYRPAPIQISFLGYPGTSGAGFMDYIIADSTVIPEQFEHCYSERIIRLPHTYQPNDDTRVISDVAFTKPELGLPEHGFVFCCFNKSYKISALEFDIWMRILNQVEGSVLWLLKPNKWVESNLKKEAKKRGIESNRIIFADKINLDKHLARHRFADLFIDTFNCNAHTTTSDALWAGLPVVTLLGKGFAARVAGSLLTAIGLPELIVETQEDYEALIVNLANNPERLCKIRKKLVANRLTKPLFSTKIYTKNLEDGYKQTHQRYLNGDPARNIIVSKCS